jgi:hypothetical protein
MRAAAQLTLSPYLKQIRFVYKGLIPGYFSCADLISLIPGVLPVLPNPVFGAGRESASSNLSLGPKVLARDATHACSGTTMGIVFVRFRRLCICTLSPLTLTSCLRHMMLKRVNIAVEFTGFVCDHLKWATMYYISFPNSCNLYTSNYFYMYLWLSSWYFVSVLWLF